MTPPNVTVVVVPGERVSASVRSIEQVYDHTSMPFDLVCVSAGAPPEVQRELEESAERRGFRLISTGRYLAPNKARNLGLEGVLTRYVVFLDNDVLVAPHWLDALVRCAESTGASIVGPVCLEGDGESATIGAAGGVLTWEGRKGTRSLFEDDRYAGLRRSELREPLLRSRCDVLDARCLLARRSTLEDVGPFDEQLLSLCQHLDLGLAVKRAGGIACIEPEATVSRPSPATCQWMDLPYFMLRWSDHWNEASLEHFKRKWDLESVGVAHDWSDDDPAVSVLLRARARRQSIAGLRVPGGGPADRQTTPIEDAKLMAALLQSMGYDSFDLALSAGEHQLVEYAAALAPEALLDRLLDTLQRAADAVLSVRMKPSAAAGGQGGHLIALRDLDRHEMERARGQAFMTLATGQGRYQCWLAVTEAHAEHGLILGPWAYPSGDPRKALGGWIPLAGSCQEGPEPDHGFRVQLVDGLAGGSTTARRLVNDGLAPLVWRSAFAEWPAIAGGPHTTH